MNIYIYTYIYTYYTAVHKHRERPLNKQEIRVTEPRAAASTTAAWFYSRQSRKNILYSSDYSEIIVNIIIIYIYIL